MDRNTELRAQRVLSSQGYAIGRTFPDEVMTALAELCGVGGGLVPDTRAKAKKIIADYHDSLKATVDPPADQEPLNFGAASEGT